LKRSESPEFHYHTNEPERTKKGIQPRSYSEEKGSSLRKKEEYDRDIYNSKYVIEGRKTANPEEERRKQRYGNKKFQ